MKRLKTPGLRTLVLAVLALALAGASPLAAYEEDFRQEAQDLARALTEAEVGSVAVVDFFDLRGRVSELGRFLADELSTALVATDSVRVIDRLRLATILAEHKISAAGLLEEGAAREVGQVAGVDVLITGRLTSFEETVRVSLEGLRMPSAEMVVSEVIEIPRTPRIAELEVRSLTVDCDPEAGHREISFDGPPVDRIEIREYEFTLRGCAWVKDEVHCGVAVQNLGDERNLYLSGKTRIVFDGGGQAQARRLGMGSDWATGGLSTVGNRLLEDIPMPIGVVFQGVPSGVSTIRLLELDFPGFYVRFRDVRLAR